VVATVSSMGAVSPIITATASTGTIIIHMDTVYIMSRTKITTTPRPLERISTG
jgi:hypothetical protein